jgi:hypothetical protein
MFLNSGMNRAGMAGSRKIRWGMAQAKRNQRGEFSLLSIMITVILVGILAFLGVQKYKQTQPPFRAAAMESATRDLTEVFLHISELCGTTTDIENSPLAGGGGTATLSFLLRGTNLQPEYQACVKNSGAKYLTTLAQGTTGQETVANYRLIPTMLDSSHIRWGFQNVPTEVALAAYNKYSNAVGAAQAMTLPSGDNSDPAFQFDAPGSNGMTTVYFISTI